MTFSRSYPRWLDPRRFAHDPRLPPAPALPILDYLSPRSWRDAARRISQSEADALIVPWWTSFWALPIRAIFRALRGGPIRRVLLCHNLEDHDAGLWQRFLKLGPFGEADAFILHSRENRREIEGQYPGRPTLALPLPALSVAGPDRDTARRALGIDGRLVLFLGLVRRYKGVEVLLEAAPRIVRETGARVAIVGEIFEEAGPVRRLSDLSPVREAVLWKDEYVSEEEMAQWLAACDALVLPYRRISSSAIAARAIGARRPIVAAAVGGLKEVVVPGQTGELFEPGDAKALADAVARIFERGGDVYAPGLERAASEMAWPRYAEKILEFVGTLREAGGGRR